MQRFFGHSKLFSIIATILEFRAIFVLICQSSPHSTAEFYQKWLLSVNKRETISPSCIEINDPNITGKWSHLSFTRVATVLNKSAQILKVRWTQCLRNERTIKSPFEERSFKPRSMWRSSRLLLLLRCLSSFIFLNKYCASPLVKGFLRLSALNEYLNSFFKGRKLKIERNRSDWAAKLSYLFEASFSHFMR